MLKIHFYQVKKTTVLFHRGKLLSRSHSKRLLSPKRDIYLPAAPRECDRKQECIITNSRKAGKDDAFCIKLAISRIPEICHTSLNADILEMTFHALRFLNMSIKKIKISRPFLSARKDRKVIKSEKHQGGGECGCSAHNLRGEKNRIENSFVQDICWNREKLNTNGLGTVWEIWVGSKSL